MKDEVYAKPSLGCLFTHQPAWDLVGVVKETAQEVWECCSCKIKFCYPTKQKDFPIYKRD